MNKIKQLSIDLTNKCSKQCSFCYNKSQKKGLTEWQPFEVVHFAQDCIQNGVEAVSLGGGEPFEYEGIFEIIKNIHPLAYISVTTNGLPLLDSAIWAKLVSCPPDKIHVTIHNPHHLCEVERVFKQIVLLNEIGIKVGINLLVSKSKIEFCQKVYLHFSTLLTPEQIILVPQRYFDTPSSQQLVFVANGQPFQSPLCLLGCTPPVDFCSVSWDKKVNRCSFAGGKAKLTSLDYAGLLIALEQVSFACCE